LRLDSFNKLLGISEIGVCGMNLLILLDFDVPLEMTVFLLHAQQFCCNKNIGMKADQLSPELEVL
jgi:hypothetical protein